jgi:hypothetical protein
MEHTLVIKNRCGACQTAPVVDWWVLKHQRDTSDDSLLLCPCADPAIRNALVAGGSIEAFAGMVNGTDVAVSFPVVIVHEPELRRWRVVPE